MKLFQYYDAEKKIRVGAVTKEGHVALSPDVIMEQLIGADEAYIAEAVKTGEGIVLEEESIVFAPVCSNPEKILCIGLNYNEHISETGLQNDTKPGFPPVFTKYNNALTAHGADLHLPEKAEQFDYEAELVIVIGRDCKNVSKEEAMDYIAGYTAGNDFSARDMQFVSSQWTMGKACDDFAPVGPYLVPKTDIDPADLAISCKVNGVYAQKSRTSKMIYSCPEIVSYLSDYITLKKGDLIFTGTPSGVILGKEKEDQVWLKAGDVVTVEIEGIGALENCLVSQK